MICCSTRTCLLLGFQRFLAGEELHLDRHGPQRPIAELLRVDFHQVLLRAHDDSAAVFAAARSNSSRSVGVKAW